MSSHTLRALTFLLTDIEGSTRLWEQAQSSMWEAVARHDRLAAEVVPLYGGELIKPRCEGDSLFIVFQSPCQAVAAAVALQCAFMSEAWPDGAPIRVRMGLHTGEAGFRDGDYYGPVINRCARLRAVGHGGQILLSQATQLLVERCLPEKVSLRNLKQHQFRDVPPDQIFQVVHPDLPADFPPLNSLSPDRHNLPGPRTSFVGREAEVRDVSRHLERVSLLTLTGPGGVGKTRLALEVAADQIERFPDGVWLVPLQTLTPGDDARVVPSVAATLGVKEEAGRPLCITLCDHLAHRRLLLVLDTCEHLIRGCAEFVDNALSACSDLKILVTSRGPLGISGEQQVRLGPLDLPPTGPALRELSVERFQNVAAPRLFLERARLIKPDFGCTERHLPLIAQICHNLDGIPLLIGLAAARVEGLALAEIARQLHDLLTGEQRHMPNRHRSAYDVIAWSYNLLAPEGQRLLRRLAVFAGGFTLESAVAVCADAGESGPQIVERLTRLVSVSLVQAEESAEGEYRYNLLHMIREYGRQELQRSGEQEAIQRRHREFFLQLAETAEPHLQQPEAAQWLDLLECEHDNLRAALRAGEPDEQRLRLAAALVRFWQIHNHYGEGREWLQRVLAEQILEPFQTVMKVTNGAGVLAYLQRDFDAAQQHFAQAREEACVRDDDDWLMRASGNLGMTLVAVGEKERARALLEESLLYCKQRSGAAYLSVLNSLCMLLYEQEEYQEAYRRMSEIVALQRAQGNLPELGTGLHNLGELARKTGDLSAAERCLIESALLRCRLGNRRDALFSLAALSLTLLQARRFRQAARLLAAATTQLRAQNALLPPEDEAEYEAAVTRLREQMAPGAFAAAWRKGSATEIEEIIAALQNNRL